jgi:hypothetical protein
MSKLELKKSTLRRLSEEDLATAAGGTSVPCVSVSISVISMTVSGASGCCVSINLTLNQTILKTIQNGTFKP